MKHHSVVHLSGNDGRGDFPPDREAVSHLGAPFGCGQSVPARPKMRWNAAQRGTRSGSCPTRSEDEQIVVVV
jgi:hypothetical protein